MLIEGLETGEDQPDTHHAPSSLFIGSIEPMRPTR
jgi:hypothetical protein